MNYFGMYRYNVEAKLHNEFSNQVHGIKGKAMQAQGVIIGRYIELLHETDLPDGLLVTVEIHSESFSLEERRKLIDELCGSWEGDSSLNPIFTEIEYSRRDSRFCVNATLVTDNTKHFEHVENLRLENWLKE